ncbi:putative nucleotidyltransferase [Algoriphagus ratkowskyi]|uniref:Nucleotidyltransferase domain-containing protein n=1 Tax=Algoriphagus ratkowskyi TaxID=57028 RepID=A0A2W7RGL9_9BACT|nr:nucleotidyltransferase domain-containing protein [Algoriphagus ratkowskyi]PZX58246.1 putative nucleotidyltransferase [Algoriphagus ratkowskyi]TXD77874.1 nucleotidyltransferase domain-containing protein [Algoriphagus ratkowskyi]
MNSKFGLLASDVEAILSVLSNHAKVERAYIFGSRAKGNYRTGSDVDLALKGSEIDFDTVSQISYLLNEETNMPYKFDVLNYHSITEPKLLVHIDRVGVEVYRRSYKS